MSLRLKIILAVATAILLCTTVILTLQTRSRLVAQDRSFLKDAGMVTELAAAGLGGALRFGKADAVATVIADLRVTAGTAITAMAGVTATGETLASLDGIPPDPSLIALARRSIETGVPVVEGFVIARPVVFGKDAEVVGALVVTWSNAELLAEVRDELTMAAIQGAALAAAIAAAMWIFLGRSLFGPLDRLGAGVRALAEGQAVALPYGERGDEIGRLARDMATVDARARETRRIKTALDKARSSVMITDEAGRILYVNEGLQASFTRHAGEIARTAPGFRPEALVGMRLEAFGIRPEPVEEKREIALGARRLEMIRTPVTDGEGALVGAMLQWRDRTEVLAAQAAVEEVARAVAAGDFGRRIDAPTDDPLTAAICSSFNTLTDAVETGIDAVIGVATALADGDLSRRMEGRFEGRFAALQEAMNGTVDRLSVLIADIQEATGEMDDRIRRIAGEAGELAGRAVSQAASLEEANATLEQIAASNQQSAETAVAASEAAGEAARGAREGSSVVGEAVSAINRIEESSTRITEIVGVIDSISLQTNLLALNAAVEAARAGEAGKGFAVVADEVRTLAQRSSEAARDIRTLIDSSAGEIAQGVDLVRRTGEVLGGLVQTISTAEDRASDIRAQSRDQASSMAEVTTAIGHLDDITQANTAMAEETAAGARALRDTAERLAALVAVFRTAPRQGGMRRAA